MDVKKQHVALWVFLECKLGCLGKPRVDAWTPQVMATLSVYESAAKAGVAL